ncbi:MAG: homoserine O-acetyltransferase [Desulfosarcinaceae bacterium]|nr:homoserine O-acetyltransferase [Desulfosarcinaceae bacterium]
MSEYAARHKDDRSVGIVVPRFYTFGEPPQEMRLASGATLGPITLAYETYGRLNDRRNNAILILHAFSGDAHVAGVHQESDEKPGWWEYMVGPGKGIDTERFFVICINILGSCMGSTGPASTNPATDQPYALDFPMVTIGDMVRAQKVLLDHLGIGRLHAVIGGSVGGMQALEWCVRYPQRVKAAVLLATTTRHSALAIAFNEVARQAIMADPNWCQGQYYGQTKPDMGLAVARMIGHVTYLSDAAMRLKFGRRLKDKTDFSFNFDADFQVESYLRYQGAKFVERFDANSLLFITKAADYFDLEREYGEGSLVSAFARAQCRFLVVSFSSDWLYPTYQSRNMVQAMKKNGLDVSFCEVEAQWGHDAFLIPNPRLSNLMRGFLTNGASPQS